VRRLRRWWPVLAALVTFSVAGCGGEDEGFKGTWLRTDDHGFVLTITRPNTTDYALKFENRANGESQTIGGIVRPNATLQAAFTIPQEPAGALAAGPPDVVAITLRVEDGLLVIRMDDGRGAETELWRYERAAE
jgi:hypothetical protein